MLKVLATVVAVVGGVMVYFAETSKTMTHPTPFHRAIPIVGWLVVVLILTAIAKARENARANSLRSSRGGSSYRYRR